MRSTFVWAWLVAVLAGFQGCSKEQSKPAAPTADAADVLKIAYSYADGGGQGTGTGARYPVRHQDAVILAAASDGKTHCSGFTFEVVVKAAQERHLLDPFDAAKLKQFRRRWFGVVPEFREMCGVAALRYLGIGVVIPPAEAMPGDFVQFWRGKDGHSVIFLEWIKHEGKHVGIRYRSSQTLTNGIGDRTEYFRDTGILDASIDPKRFYVARLLPPRQPSVITTAPSPRG